MSIKVAKNTNLELVESLSSLKSKLVNKIDKVENRVMDAFDSLSVPSKIKFYETTIKISNANRDKILQTVTGTLENAKRQKTRVTTGRPKD